MKLNIEVDIELADALDNNAIARIYYPNDKNKIIITKGLNTISVSQAIFHEIGHLIDWYLSNSTQSKTTVIREENANIIGESLRWRESSSI